MMMVASAPCSLLLALFAAVPLGIIIAIFALESAFALGHRRRPAKQPESL